MAAADCFRCRRERAVFLVAYGCLNFHVRDEVLCGMCWHAFRPLLREAYPMTTCACGLPYSDYVVRILVDTAALPG